MKLRGFFILISFIFLGLIAYPQEQQKKSSPKTVNQSQNKTSKKPPKKVPNSKAKIKKNNSRIKNNNQKQKMKRFVRKTNIKRKRGLKR